MKGLLIKDLKLMKNQKNFFLVILVVIAFLAAGSDDLSFPMEMCIRDRYMTMW